eukprot:CAMPEP_0181222840 /NCGR_PEP_ID=MMETSP1096-20121128/30191_1 /TAXON_ID=156174 ORGANISM="Chrysochromulina ericina, Strain CCMP281" /NCGR_SAMPLE_ID=MMETSP1096 /ASSEMBLY_ACC=CAM_ASM_000453 /LENGTH=51 /DNA_ID=CAMNT_0023315649 /DNA_START=378 /DNA_END=533 /DNA_ORIENTATION=+
MSRTTCAAAGAACPFETISKSDTCGFLGSTRTSFSASSRVFPQAFLRGRGW